MVSPKGKEVAGDDYLGKRKRGDGDGDKAGRRWKRKNRSVLQFFDDAAYEVEDEDEESDESDYDDGKRNEKQKAISLCVF